MKVIAMMSIEQAACSMGWTDEAVLHSKFDYNAATRLRSPVLLSRCRTLHFAIFVTS